MRTSPTWTDLRLRFQSVKRQWRKARAEVERAGAALGHRPMHSEPVIEMGKVSVLHSMTRVMMTIAAVVLALLAAIGVTTVLLQLAALWLVLSRGLGIRLSPSMGGT
jgi:fatty acid desaturase